MLVWTRARLADASHNLVESRLVSEFVMKKDRRFRPREKTKPRPKQKSESRRKSKPKRKPKPNPNPAILFTPDKQPPFGREFCFLCGVELAPDRNTDEHVIPRWIQERYELWTQRLTLLNHTTIPYRQLTIPCCATCNNQHLGKIEMQVQAACDAGREAVLALPPLTLFLCMQMKSKDNGHE